MGKRLTTEEFISKSELIHSGKYTYSQVTYYNSKTKVEITCNLHGKFHQAPTDHLSGKGCPFCAGKYKKTTEQFILEANIVHKDRYDYSLAAYKSAHEFITILCKEHGPFSQKAYSHLQGKGCDKCGGTHKYNTETFIEKAKIIHFNKYDYSSTEYKLAHTRIKIHCKQHGEFIQLPYVHLQGFGCYQCAESKGEKVIRNFLLENNIFFESQKTFDNCKDKGLLKFDFYLPNYNLCIEYDGEQHFMPIEQFGGKTGLKNTKRRDKIKTNYCINNKIHLLRIPYNKDIHSELNGYFVI